MARLRRRALVLSALLAASSFLVTQRSATPAPPSPPIFDLQIKGGLVSLRAEGVPLAAILAAMGAAAGTDVVIKGRLDGKVRDAFAGLPLQRAWSGTCRT